MSEDLANMLKSEATLLRITVFKVEFKKPQTDGGKRRSGSLTAGHSSQSLSELSESRDNSTAD